MRMDDACDLLGLDVAASGGVAEVLPLAGEVLVVDVADIDTDLAYALRQLRDALKCGGPFAMHDRVQRAVDALERIESKCQDVAWSAAG